MSTGEEPGFGPAWEALALPARRCLELAYQTLVAGGLAVGSVLVDGAGRIVAEGRNRAYDPPGGRDVLQGTPLAHAEMNVLAAVDTGQELVGCTLWSTQEPCAMCTAAASFTEVGAVTYLAPDPWAVAAEVASAGAGWSVGFPDGRWLVTANVLFLHSIARARGTDHPTVAGNLEAEPETAALVVDLEPDALVDSGSIATALPAVWDRVVAAATRRAERVGRTAG